MEGGTVRALLSAEIATARPPEGAAALRVTVHVALPPEATVAGLQASPVICAGGAVTLMEAALELPFAVAVIRAAVVAETVPAVAVRSPVVLPAGIVMEGGTVRALLSSEIVTARPPGGAAALRVTVHVALPPEATVAGTQTKAEGTIGAIRLSEALAARPSRLAVSATVLSTATLATDAAKLAEEAPAATVTEAGIVAKALPLDSATTRPPSGADPSRVTMQSALPVPVNEEGVQLKLDKPTGISAGIVTRPPAAEVGMLWAVNEVANAFTIATGLLRFPPDDKVRVAVATTPSAIVVESKP
jgi:hypothetical protein